MKWALYRLLADPKSQLKHLYVAIESLRNFFDMIQKHLKDFLLVSLDFQPPVADTSEIREFWAALGMEPDVVETLCELQPSWDSEKEVLFLSSEWDGRPDVFEDLTGVMFYAFRFKKFPDSRWMTLGAASRTLIASTALGLLGLVK